jgi:hypothetical protein
MNRIKKEVLDKKELSLLGLPKSFVKVLVLSISLPITVANQALRPSF